MALQSKPRSPKFLSSGGFKRKGSPSFCEQKEAKNFLTLGRGGSHATVSRRKSFFAPLFFQKSGYFPERIRAARRP
jgi:hypothetical protein